MARLSGRTPFPESRRAASTAAAAPTRTFFGSQPRSAHVPPNGRLSIIATVQPALRHLDATACAAVPEPITTRSKVSIICETSKPRAAAYANPRLFASVSQVGAVSRLKVEAYPEVDLPHVFRGRRPSEEWGRHGPAVAEIVGRVGEILALHEEEETITRRSLIERSNGRRGAAAEDAHAGRQRDGPAEGELIRREQIDGRLRARAKRVAADAAGAIVEDPVAVVVAARQKGVRLRRVGVHVERHQKVPHDLIVQTEVDAVADVVRRRTPLGGKSAGRGNRERTVAVVSQVREGVVDEQRRPLPADARSVE